MRRWWVVVLWAVCVGCRAAGGALPPLPPLASLPSSVASEVVSGEGSGAAVRSRLRAPHNGAFDLHFVTVGQVCDLIYGDVLHVPYVIASDVLEDARVVSFQFDSSQGDLDAFMRAFLDAEGFKVVVNDGVSVVGKKTTDDVKAARVSFVYRPKYRTADYLQKLVQPFFDGAVSVGGSNGAGAGLPGPAAASEGPSGAQVSPNASQPVSGGFGGANGSALMASQQAGASAADVLVMFGKRSDIAAMRSLLPQLDTAPGEVVVRGWVYEVSNTDAKNTAFSIAAQVFNGVLGVSSGSTSADGNAFTFNAHFLQAAVSALAADSRFKEVSDPHVRVVSGGNVVLNVGSQVPTVASVSYQGTSGTPVQSVAYQSAGVIFNVSPTVLDDAIRLKLDEEVSSFVATTTGVNNTPTKNTREMQTTVSLKDGDVVVLGGLVQDSDSFSTSHEGFLPHFLDGKAGSKGRTEVLLVLQVQKV